MKAELENIVWIVLLCGGVVALFVFIVMPEAM
jgi:hypothetical protein